MPAADDFGGEGSGVGDFRFTFPASPSGLAPLRARLRGWLRDLLVSEDLVRSIVLSVSEAAANSIEHGLRFDPGGAVTVVGAVSEDGLVELTVLDDGSWRSTRAREHRGYGLRIINGVMDEVGVDRRSTGTVVRMSLRTRSSPARML